MTIPFRAGATSPASGAYGIPQAPAAFRPAAFTGPTVLLADVSEFQPDIADAAYLAWSPAIVIRAAYGASHDDKAWYGGARRAALHAGGVRFLGIYEYLVAGQDGAAQADVLAGLVGPLQRGEVLIADFEEGDRAMLTAWYNRMSVHHAYPVAQLWTYSGLNFGTAAGVMPVEWVAAYGQAEPSPPHKLWQFTDAYSVPGVGVADCSVFHGGIDELAALAWQAPVTPPPVPPVTYPVPSGIGLTVHPLVNFTWPAGNPVSPHWRLQVMRDNSGQPGDVIGPNGSVLTTIPRATVQLPGPGVYWVKVQAAGNSPFSTPRRFTA